MNRRFSGIYAVALVSILSAVAGCGNREDIRPASSTRILMDTYVTFTIYDDSVPGSDRRADLDSVFAEVRRVEEQISSYISTSEISAVNHSAGIEPVTVGDAVRELLQTSQDMSNASDGAFDITVKPLMDLWDVRSEHPKRPADEQVERLLPLTDYKKLAITDQQVYLTMRGMGIDLGAIGKGYAIDRGVALLVGMGHDHVVANAGGNILIYNTTGKPHTIGIRHPLAESPDSCIAEFSLVSGGIATSGDYERFFIEDGVKYHHILDPSTGFPARLSKSVTIITDNAMYADGLSTAAFVKGPIDGLAMLETLPGVEGVIFYERNGRIEDAVTSGMTRKYGYRRYEED